ncbi:MAG: hypothetical protein IPN86_22840 [Saprospiraceae bacterium]|nr:hypothetical protein [Saprospiraceae bacterium]
MKIFKLFFYVLMAGMLLFLSGCQREEGDFDKSNHNILENRTDNSHQNGFLEYRKPIAGFPNLDCLGTEFWDKDELLFQMASFERFIDKKNGQYNCGVPVWGATIIQTFNNEILRITPIVNDGTFERKNIFISFTYDNHTKYILQDYLLWENDIENDSLDIVFSSKPRIKCPGFGGNMKRGQWSKKDDGITGSDGWDNDIDWGSFGGGGSGGGNLGGSGSSGGGSGISNTRLHLYNSYFNPKGGYANCDVKLTTAKGCEDFITKVFGTTLSSAAKANLQEKIETCGCYNALLVDNEIFNKSKSDPQLKCLSCYAHQGQEFGYYFKELYSMITDIKLPCTNNSAEIKNNAKNKALENICQSASFHLAVYPGQLIKKYLEEIKNLNISYIYPVIDNFFGIGKVREIKGSDDQMDMKNLLGLSGDDILNADEQTLCFKKQIAECLKPAEPGGPIGVNEAEKAALLDFYKNTELTNPCTGDAIDKDAIFLGLCEEGDLSMSGLEAALDGVDYITSKELDDSKEIFEILGITNEADKLKFLSGSDCGSDGGGKCKNCSVGEAGIVFLDHERAKQMLDCAINKLKNYNGSDATIKNALVSSFNTDSKNAVSFIKTLCQWIKFQSINTAYESDLNCGNSTLAWSYPAIQFTNIHLCNPNYWNVLDDQERSATMIHEMFHLYYIAGDWAYIWEEEFHGLTPLQHLTNSDSFSEFINAICL